MLTRSLNCLLLLTVLFAAVLSCGGGGTGTIPDNLDPRFKYTASDKPRDLSPPATDSDLNTLAAGNTDFALDLYNTVATGSGNVFCSPYSISIALAMTYAGARTDTETQMADTLHFSLSQTTLHPAFNRLDLELASRGQGSNGKDGEPFKLKIANSIWGQNGDVFKPEFLDTLSTNYGAGLRLLDFIADPENSRVTINSWVSEKTEQKINDLIPKGIISTDTRLVLTNAIYFNAAWEKQFKKEMTADGDFHVLDGSTVSVPMMNQVEQFNYGSGDGWQAIELPYDGNEVSMLLIVPDSGKFAEFETAFNSATLTAILDSLSERSVRIVMPKFKIESSFALSDALKKMGMPLAFQPGLSDFSGMDGTRELFIREVIHKAYADIDEEGTEAAAATAVIIDRLSAPMEDVALTIDRPFIFLIRDIETGTILFLGHVTNP